MGSVESFRDFITQRFQVPRSDVLSTHEWSGTGNTIGALALRLGILSIEQIDQILDQQEVYHRLFGELAIDMGFMSNDDVERLIGLQIYHQILEVAENLVMRGALSLHELPSLIDEYYRQEQSAVEATAAAAV